MKNTVKDKRFVAEAREYGIHLVKDTVKTGEFKDKSAELMVRTFTRDLRVKREAVDLLKYFVNHPETVMIAAGFAKAAVL